MKKITLIFVLLIGYFTADAQYYRLRYDSVGIVSKLILNTVTTGEGTDSILVKKPNGGVYKIAQASLGGLTYLSSSNNDIGVTNPSTAPILTLNASSATGANKVMRRDASGDVAITSNLYFQSASNRIQSDTYDMYFKTGTSGTGDFYWKSNNDATQAMKLTYTGDLTVLNGMSVGNTIVGGAGATFVGSVSVADEAYDPTTWNSNLTAPTKNAIRDKIESMSGGTSGTYTPTISDEINCSGFTVSIGHYIRVGNEVTVFGRVQMTVTATSSIAFNISLPIASNLSVAQDLSGLAASNGIAATIVGDGSNNNAEAGFTSGSSTSVGFNYSFTYTVI